MRSNSPTKQANSNLSIPNTNSPFSSNSTTDQIQLRLPTRKNIEKHTNTLPTPNFSSSPINLAPSASCEHAPITSLENVSSPTLSVSPSVSPATRTDALHSCRATSKPWPTGPTTFSQPAVEAKRSAIVEFDDRISQSLKWQNGRLADPPAYYRGEALTRPDLFNAPQPRTNSFLQHTTTSSSSDCLTNVDSLSAIPSADPSSQENTNMRSLSPFLNSTPLEKSAQATEHTHQSAVLNLAPDSIDNAASQISPSPVASSSSFSDLSHNLLDKHTLHKPKSTETNANSLSPLLLNQQAIDQTQIADTIPEQHTFSSPIHEQQLLISCLTDFLPPALSDTQLQLLKQDAPGIDKHAQTSDCPPKKTDLLFYLYPANLTNITYKYSRAQMRQFAESFDTPRALDCKNANPSNLWYLPVKIHHLDHDARLALFDTGCSHTCMGLQVWNNIKDKDCLFTACSGKVTGISEDMTLQIVGQAVISLFFLTSSDQLLRLRVRVLIINKLNTPIFLGRDIFKNPRVFEMLKPDGLYLKSLGETHHVPFIKEQTSIAITNQGTPSLNLLQASSDSHNILSSKQSHTLPPTSSQRIEVFLQDDDDIQSNYHDLTVEILQLDESQPEYRIIPCVNIITHGRTEILIENLSSKPLTIQPNSRLAHISKTSHDYDFDTTAVITNLPNGAAEKVWLNRAHCMAHNLETAQTDIPDQSFETEEPFVKPDLHLPNLDKFRDVLCNDPIPDKYNTKLRKPTLSIEQLLAKFELDHLPDNVKQHIIKLIIEYRHMWSEFPHDVGLHKYIKHHIILTDKLPPSQKQRFWPSHKREAAEKLIDALEKQGIIQNTIADYATNIVLVGKAADPANKAIEQPLLDKLLEGAALPAPPLAKYRLVLDLRPTNSVTQNDVATLGNMDSLFLNMAGKNVRSSFDFTDGFFQIGLTEESQGTTFFVSRKSGSCIMRFNRSIQGSKNASNVFTRAMAVTYADCPPIQFWVDDVIVFSKTVAQHMADIELTFYRTSDSNLKMSPEKCKFLAGEIKYLGMIVKNDSFMIAQKKLGTIIDLPAPKSFNNLRSQLALFQYYKKFIPFFNDITSVLSPLMKKNVPFIWTQKHTDAHSLMKELFLEKIKLRLPDPSLPYVIHTDASSHATSAVLHQRVGDELFPVAFHSQTLDETQLKHSILDKELYALVDSIKRFEFYLSGAPFEVFTDSKVLFYLREAKESNAKLYRYSLLLQGYDFTITHLSSSENMVADALSRINSAAMQDKAREVNMAKKDILDSIRDKISRMSIPSGSVLSRKDITTFLNKITPIEIQAAAILENKFHTHLSPCERAEKVTVFVSHMHPEPHMPEDMQQSIELQKQVLAATSFQSGNMDIEDFINLQKADKFCQETYKILDKPPLNKRFKIKQGVLLRLPGEIDTNVKAAHNQPQIVIPDIMVDMLIDMFHAGPYGAHMGTRRVYQTIRQHNYFRNMQDRINARIKQCLPCQLNLYTTRKPHKLHLTTSSDIPREAVGIDLCPDFPPVRQFNHVMIMVDLATNFVTLRAIKTKSSKELLGHFKTLVGTFGPPKLVRHDNEKGLTDGEFKLFCEEMKINQVLGLPHQGQTNGRVESQVRNAKIALRALTTAQASTANWPDELWKVELQMNAYISSATNLSPEMLIFGHEAQKTLQDILQINYLLKKETFEDHEKLPIDTRIEIIKQASAGRQSQLDKRNLKLAGPKFQVGDIVWKKTMQPASGLGLRHALDCKYGGPYKIIEISHSTAIIASIAVKLCGPTHVHLDQLKPFSAGRPELSPAWAAAINHRLNLLTRTSTRSRSANTDAFSNTHAPPISIPAIPC